MDNFFDFAPDPARAKRLDARMQIGLAHSLEHILERAAGLDGLNASALRTVADSIHAGKRYPPGAFGRYYELVFALLDQQLDEAVALSAHFSNLKPFRGEPVIAPLNETALGDEAALFRRRIGPDADERYLSPPADMAASFKTQLEAAIALADDCMPAITGEFRAVVRQVVLSTTAEGGDNHFGSASAYQLWGLMVLNPRRSGSVVELVATLAHETAHSLLFGFAFDEALVLNGDDELFSSPLRTDPRPMDGVFHATFVCARMHWALSRLAEAGGVDGTIRDQAAKAAGWNAEKFADGLHTVDTSARLTDTGRSLMEGARAYMKAAA